MRSVKISVVVPTFNEEKGIEKFLKQFSRQTLPRNEFEIIISDGNSTDRTRELAKKYANKVIIQQSEGIGGARNDGVRVAEAEIIATTDADILVSRTWLEKIVDQFEKDKELVLLFGSNYPITKRKAIKFFSQVKRWENVIGAGLRIFYFAEGTNTAFRKAPFLKIGGYSDMPILDDMEVTFRIKKLGKIKYDGSIYIYSSTRRADKYGIGRFGIDALSSYLKIIFFGKDYHKIKRYAKEEYGK